MNQLDRRQFLKILGAASVLACPPALSAQVRPHVVVVGGGFGGSTAAKYLRMWSAGAIDVTLIVPEAAHASCILSNLVLTGQVKLPNITFAYDVLAAKYGIRFVKDRVVRINPGAAGGSVGLQSGGTIEYDRLVLAPGISFDAVPGLEADNTRSDGRKLVPHAWIAGAQTTNLQKQLAAMPARGTFILTIPPKPYRCPPGPYERACVVADYLKRVKRGGKVIVLDANPGITAEVHTFTNAFNNLYRGIVQYVPNAALTRVAFKKTSTGAVKRVAYARVSGSTRETAFTGDVLNVLPMHKAGSVLFQSGLGLINVGGRWAGIDALSYESTAVANIHIIGDAQATGQPKAGHIANGEAKICADAIIRLFGGNRPHPEPITNSACYSPITNKSASWLTGSFRYDSATKGMVSIPESAGEAPSISGDHYKTMFAWAQNLFSDTFM